MCVCEGLFYVYIGLFYVCIGLLILQPNVPHTLRCPRLLWSLSFPVFEEFMCDYMGFFYVNGYVSFLLQPHVLHTIP